MPPIPMSGSETQALSLNEDWIQFLKDSNYQCEPTADIHRAALFINRLEKGWPEVVAAYEVKRTYPRSIQEIEEALEAVKNYFPDP